MYMKVLREQIHATCAILHTPGQLVQKEPQSTKVVHIPSDRRDVRQEGWTEPWNAFALSNSVLGSHLAVRVGVRH